MNNTKKEVESDVKLIPTAGRLIARIASVISWPVKRWDKGYFRILALLIMALGVTAYQANAQQQAVDTTQIQATFDNLAAGFEAAVEAGDFEAQASIYAEDAIYSHPMMKPVRGRDSIKAVLKKVTPPGSTADIQPIETKIIAPDWVYEYGTVIFTFTPEGSDTPQKISNTYFALFHRTADGWKITREALSMNQPPPGSK